MTKKISFIAGSIFWAISISFIGLQCIKVVAAINAYHVAINF